jgi:hypothetical protein
MESPSIDEMRERLWLLEALFWELLDYVPVEERPRMMHFYANRWRVLPS